ncbi:unnamed protein product, partial [Ectocarpus sp. 4 AP-2014]
SLLLLDWYTAGRCAMGERWVFERYATENRIQIGGRLVALDRLRMDRDDAPIDGRFAIGRYNCFATVMLVGPAFEDALAGLQDTVRDLPLGQCDPLLVSFSRLDWGGVLRLAGMGAEPVRAALAQRLSFVEPMLGCGLWERKW